MAWTFYFRMCACAVSIEERRAAAAAERSSRSHDCCCFVAVVSNRRFLFRPRRGFIVSEYARRLLAGGYLFRSELRLRNRCRCRHRYIFINACAWFRLFLPLRFGCVGSGKYRCSQNISPSNDAQQSQKGDTYNTSNLRRATSRLATLFPSTKQT